MITRNEVVKELDLSAEELQKELDEVLQPYNPEDIPKMYEESIKDFEVDTILTGKILKIISDDVIVDVGYKSEGIIPLDQFDDPVSVDVGDVVEVLLEAVEDDSGLIVISKRKADRIRAWEKVISTHEKGDVVRGRVIRKIKGGLLVDIGVPVFLPASQVSIRRVWDIGQWIGREIECKILKIDPSRMNIVVSRRRLVEERREEQKKKLLATLKEGDLVRGVVKNIVDFGAFVDLGGLDGLLHITDMSWGRISHPSEMLAIDDEIEVKVIKIDKERERISLGLKQKTPSPWLDVEEKYPIGSRVRGKVVNVLGYGAFVKLETGIEGLVHISEMSWTRRINHPSDVVAIGDTVEVVVLAVNKQKEEISLGMKQVEPNPWDLVEEKYPPGTIIEGRVRNLTNYGAFIEIEEGIDGLLHISDISWTKKIVHPSEILRKGDRVKVMVLTVDPERKRVALGIKQLTEDPWEREIPERYRPGTVVTGKVTKITNFGVFVELEEDLEGLLHISEIADRKIDNPAEEVSTGDIIDVKVIRVDGDERKIGLSLKQVAPEERLTIDYGRGDSPGEEAIRSPEGGEGE